MPSPFTQKCSLFFLPFIGRARAPVPYLCRRDQRVLGATQDRRQLLFGASDVVGWVASYFPRAVLGGFYL